MGQGTLIHRILRQEKRKIAKWIMDDRNDNFCNYDQLINFLLTSVSYNDGNDERQRDINLNERSALRHDEELHKNL